MAKGSTLVLDHGTRGPVNSSDRIEGTYSSPAHLMLYLHQECMTYALRRYSLAEPRQYHLLARSLHARGEFDIESRRTQTTRIEASRLLKLQ